MCCLPFPIFAYNPSHTLPPNTEIFGEDRCLFLWHHDVGGALAYSLSNTLAGTHPHAQKQMLTGKTPYTDESNIDVVIKVIKDGYRPTIPTGTPPAIASLMRACWAADPGDRPTFSEIIARLDKHLKTLK